MNDWDKDSKPDSHFPDEENIPELTQNVPVLDQMIPELTERIDLAVQPKAKIDLESSSDTVEEQLHRHRHELDTPQPSLVPVITDAVSSNELELQQWQIEQQATIQAGEWQELANIESVKAETPTLSVVADNINSNSDSLQTNDSSEESEEIYINDDVEAILHASWQRLENLIMTRMPAEIAGAYLSLLEQKIYQNKVTLGKDLSLLDQDSLDELLDEFDIDRGF
ncbi:MAG: hypothetical protein KJO69_00350 [Gammaproteobacteria bacterium]|nr:hypothetical protein [Gammaproteobacteria bacterium]